MKTEIFAKIDDLAAANNVASGTAARLVASMPFEIVPPLVHAPRPIRRYDYVAALVFALANQLRLANIHERQRNRLLLSGLGSLADLQFDYAIPTHSSLLYVRTGELTKVLDALRRCGLSHDPAIVISLKDARNRAADALKIASGKAANGGPAGWLADLPDSLQELRETDPMAFVQALADHHAATSSD